MRRDAVRADVREFVLERDGGCVATRIASERQWAIDSCEGRLTLDHVKDQPMMGRRAPSDPKHLVTICWHHHLDGWATAHRPELREYLKGVNA
jgi:hypothetical protein